MRAALLSLSKHLCAAETIPPRVNWPKALAAVVAPHIAALVTISWIERNAFAFGLALLTWCFLNGVWLALLRRPALAAALSLIMIEALIVLSQFKINIQQMSVSFFDFLVVDADTISFLLMIFPVCAWASSSARLSQHRYWYCCGASIHFASRAVPQ